MINILEIAMAIGFLRLKVFSDSQLVACQISSEYEARGEQMIKYQQFTRNLMEEFMKVYIELVPRADNMQDDALPRLATLEGIVDMDNIAITKLNTPSVSRLTINIDEIIWTS